MSNNTINKNKQNENDDQPGSSQSAKKVALTKATKSKKTSYLDQSDSEEEDEEKENDEENISEKKKTENTKRTKWTAMEDRQLCISWASTSMVEVTGIDQKTGKYWERIHAHYIENLGVKISEMKQTAKKGKKVMELNKRTPNALKIQWGKIQAKTMKFLKYFQEAESKSCNDVMAEATNEYNSLEDDDFDFRHCFSLLRDLPKFHTVTRDAEARAKAKAKAKAVTGSDDANEGEFPPCTADRKQEKKRRFQGEGDSDLIAEIMQKKIKADEKHYSKVQQELKRSNSIAQSNSDREMMSVDLGLITDPESLEFFQTHREIIMLRTKLELERLRAQIQQEQQQQQQQQQLEEENIEEESIVVEDE